MLYFGMRKLLVKNTFWEYLRQTLGLSPLILQVLFTELTIAKISKRLHTTWLVYFLKVFRDRKYYYVLAIFKHLVMKCFHILLILHTYIMSVFLLCRFYKRWVVPFFHFWLFLFQNSRLQFFEDLSTTWFWYFMNGQNIIFLIYLYFSFRQPMNVFILRI